MAHATLRELEEHASGMGDPALESHLESCSTCSEQLERVRANGMLVERLRAGRAAPIARPDAALAAQPFEGYRVTRELHRGGQGIVYGAVQLATSRQVAIKVLAEGIFASPAKQRRFEREIELVSALRHPNIVTVYDSGTTADDRDFLVMEYVRGEPLHRFVERANLSRRELVRLCAKVAAAVGYAHQRGVIHRDLKPNNVLVDTDGEPRVLDFGLARGTLAATAERTRSNQFLGTLAFASPEQVGGDPEAVDVRTDVYSLGVLFYRLLAGRSPYGEASSMADLVAAIARADPPRPIGDADLDAVLRRAMEREREHRYQSAGELAADLEHVLVGRPVDARRDSTWYVFRKLLWRHRVVAGFSALTALAVVAGAVASLTGWRRAEAAAEHARIETAKTAELNGFLAGLFEAVDPWQARGANVSVRELLDDASTRLEADPPDEATVARELHALLGRSYFALGHYALAEPHLEAALARETETGSAPRLEGRLLLGENLLALGELDRAQELMDRAGRELAGVAGREDALGRVRRIEVKLAQARGDEAQADRLFGEAADLLSAAGSRIELARLHLERGQYLSDLGRLPAAAAELARSEALVDELGLRGSVLDSTLLRSQGRLFVRQGDPARAADAFRAALDIAVPLAGEDHPRTMNLFAQLAYAKLGAGQPLAADIADRVRAARTEAPVGPSEDLAMLWNDLGLVSERWDELDEAERCYERSLECYDALPGSFEASTPVLRSNLSWLLHLRGEDERAETVGRRALEVFARTPARWPTQLVRCASNQMWIRYQNGRPEQAAEAAALGMRVAEQELSPDSAGYAEALSDVGLVQLRSHQLDGAETDLRAAIEVLERTVDPLDMVLVFARHRLALVLKDRHQPEADAEAEDMFLRVADEYAGAPGDHLGDTVRVLNEAAYLQERRRRPQEALATYLHAAELCRDAGPGLADPRVVSLSNAARLHGEAGDRETEQTLLRDAVSTSRMYLPLGHPHRHAPLILLAMSLEATGRGTEALALREELHACLLEAFGPDNPETEKAANELFERYEKLGATERAEHLRALRAARER